MIFLAACNMSVGVSILLCSRLAVLDYYAHVLLEQ